LRNHQIYKISKRVIIFFGRIPALNSESVPGEGLSDYFHVFILYASLVGEAFCVGLFCDFGFVLNLFKVIRIKKLYKFSGDKFNFLIVNTFLGLKLMQYWDKRLKCDFH